MKHWIVSFLILVLTTSFIGAEEEEQNKQPAERVVETTHTLKINGKQVRYKATAAQAHLKDDEGKVKATFFYIAYTKEGVKDQSQRPITFCFNGGPGSSSVWLHMGVLGPKRVAMDDEGHPLKPYRFVDNEFSLLDVSDLVFIDPVSTGYSRAASGEDPKQFHGFEEDIKSVGEFIRLYTTRNGRWLSPKFIAGESYGTTRAAGLALHMHEEHNMHVDGIVLISAALNFQTFRFCKGNDLPYITYLPAYAATAWYHNKISHDTYSNLAALLKDAETFAYDQYATALMKGELLTDKEQQEVVQKLSLFTGLSEEYIKKFRLRVPIRHYTKELLRDTERVVGRFDSRFDGIDFSHDKNRMEYDPSLKAALGAFTPTFNHYLRSELKWEEDQEYQILTNVFPWDWGKAKGQYLNVAPDLQEVMSRNPDLKVFIANGYYDLAASYFATQYTINHLDLDPAIRDHITTTFYESGHMMYNHKPSLIKLKQNLTEFYQ